MIYLRSFLSFYVKYKFFIHTTTKGWGGQRPNSWQTCSGVKLLLSMFSMMMGIWAWRTRLQVATRSGEMTARAAQMAAIQSAIYTHYITVYSVTAGYSGIQVNKLQKDKVIIQYANLLIFVYNPETIFKN